MRFVLFIDLVQELIVERFLAGFAAEYLLYWCIVVANIWEDSTALLSEINLLVDSELLQSMVLGDTRLLAR